MSNKVLDNLVALDGYIVSIKCGLAKARNGSDVEDQYVLEKLGNFANRMGYELVRKAYQNIEKTKTILLHTVAYEYADGGSLSDSDEENIAYRITQGVHEGELYDGSDGHTSGGKWRIKRGD
jgi:hypothetical protein